MYATLTLEPDGRRKESTDGFHQACEGEREPLLLGASRERLDEHLGRMGRGPSTYRPTLLWMDEILHHLRNPEMMIPL